MNKGFLCCFLLLASVSVGISFPGDRAESHVEDTSGSAREETTLKRGLEFTVEEQEERETLSKRSCVGQSLWKEKDSSLTMVGISRYPLLEEEFSTNKKGMELNASSGMTPSSTLPLSSNTEESIDFPSAAVGHFVTDDGVRDLVSIPHSPSTLEETRKRAVLDLGCVVAGAVKMPEESREKVMKVLEQQSDLLKIDQFQRELTPAVDREIDICLQEAPNEGADPLLLQQLSRYRDHAKISFQKQRMNSALSWLAMAKKIKEVIVYDLKEKKATKLAGELELTNEEQSVQESTKAAIWKQTVVTTKEWVDANKSYLHAYNAAWLSEKELQEVTKAGSSDKIAEAAQEVVDCSQAVHAQEMLLSVRALKMEYLFNAAKALDRISTAENLQAIRDAIKEATDWKEAAALL